MAKINSKRGIGHIQKLTASTEAFEWKICDYVSLPLEADSIFYSPQFSYLDAIWCLYLIPNGLTKSKTVGWMALGLLKLKPRCLDHCVAYKFGIRKEDGTEYICWSGEENFGENGYNWVVEDLLETSKFLEKLSDIAPHGDITVFCTLHGKSGEFDETKYQIDWQKGIDKLLRNLRDLLDSGEGSDVTVKVAEREFRVHKAILISRSPVFSAMFRHDMVERYNGIVNISNCDPDAFRDFLAYLYSGKVENISVKKTLALYVMADIYDTEELKTECVKYMIRNLSVDSFCDVVILALRHKEPELLEIATAFFAENTEEIIRTLKWFVFHKDYPVESNELHIKALNYAISGVKKKKRGIRIALENDPNLLQNQKESNSLQSNRNRIVNYFMPKGKYRYLLWIFICINIVTFVIFCLYYL